MEKSFLPEDCAWGKLVFENLCDAVADKAPQLGKELPCGRPTCELTAVNVLGVKGATLPKVALVDPQNNHTPFCEGNV